MNECKCRPHFFFYGKEIVGYKGDDYDRLFCRNCSNLFWLEKLVYWLYGYKNNNQIIDFKKSNWEIEGF